MTKFSINVNELEKIRTKKLTYKGQTKDLDVYRIPIKMLFYNDMNGRIATFISQYKADGNDITALDNEEYNNKIAEFIKASSTKERFKKTKEDIRANTQKEVGVVLTDGRIIDGNRRFTCLRELFLESAGDSRYAYFEAVVLPAPSSNDSDDWKAINSLELELQIGTDEKVDYSPIDWLVKVYQDIVKDRYYTEQEFSRLTKYKPSDVKKMITKAELMEDFLEFFDRPEQFFIAKRLELDGPLTELVKVRRKCNDREWDENKVVFYVYLWDAKKGDKTREVRRMISLVGTPKFAELINTASERADEILHGEPLSHYLDKTENKMSPTSLNAVLNNERPILEDTSNTFQSVLDNALHDKSAADARNKPITACEAALKNLNEIDKDIVGRWTDLKTKDRYKDLLNDLANIIEDLKQHVS